MLLDALASRDAEGPLWLTADARWTVEVDRGDGLGYPQDLVACAGQLYVADWGCGRWEESGRLDEHVHRDRGRVWRVCPKGERPPAWPI
mgnify:CR=1 FL=1